MERKNGAIGGWHKGTLCGWHPVSGLDQCQHPGCDVVLILQDVTKRGARSRAHRVSLCSSLQLHGNLQLSQNAKFNVFEVTGQS